jgi:hypothetical protein
LRLRLHPQGAHAASVEVVEKPRNPHPGLIGSGKRTRSRWHASLQALQLQPECHGRDQLPAAGQPWFEDFVKDMGTDGMAGITQVTTWTSSHGHDPTTFLSDK